MGTMGGTWPEMPDLGPGGQRAGQSSEGRGFHSVQVRPGVLLAVLFHSFFFSGRSSNVPKVFWQRPHVLPFPRLSQKQNNHGQVQLHTSVRLSQRHVVTQDGARPWDGSPDVEISAD